VKSLYYCRSLSIQRAENVAGEALTAAPLGDQALSAPLINGNLVDAPSTVPLGTPAAPQQSTDYEECLSCQ
jgi:ribonucleoside-diphosphate reductase alpha chain